MLVRNIAMASWFFCVVLLCWIPVASSQSIAMDQLPGHQLYEEASKAISSVRAAQIQRPHWSADGVFYFSLDGARMQVELATGQISEATDEPEQPKKSAAATRANRSRVARARQRTTVESPDGKWKAIYRNFNIVLEPVETKATPNESANPIDVTTKGTEKHRFGTACWVYGEELSQQDAMWWSPDSKKLAFYEIDEQHMKTYYLTTRNTQAYTSLHQEQYPKAGEDNPHVALHVYDLEQKSTTRLQLDGPIDQYIYGIDFSPHGDELIFHRTNRWQNQLDIMAADPVSASTRTVLTESQETWQNNSPLMQYLKDGQRFIWETERNGWKQFELRHLQGHKINALTPDAEYPCHRIVKLDEEAGWLYYTAFSGETPMDVHLHRVRLDGTQHAKLTQLPMHHSAFNISPDHQWFVAQYEMIETPPATGLFNMSGEQVAVLVESDRQAVTDAGLQPSELFSFTARDGKTTLYGYLDKPRGFDESRQYPLLINVYGGPLSNSGVSNRFRAGNPFCEYGFLVARIANRGTTGRGKAFESATYLQLGGPDLDDQADGVRFLTQRPYVDGGRVGITGHSYGGYLSALALLKYPDVFHVGVAGAPVTHWKNYDTIYTERFMRTPQENKDGYEVGSCLRFADQLKGKLFILHGLVDDNVHPANTWQLADALQKADKRFDLMVFPNSAHGFRYNSLKWEYFVRHLRPTPSAQN